MHAPPLWSRCYSPFRGHELPQVRAVARNPNGEARHAKGYAVRIGVVPNLDRGLGGIYQYAVTLLSVLPDVVESGDEVTLFLYAGEQLPADLQHLRYPCVELRSVAGIAGAAWYGATSVLPISARHVIKRLLKRVAGARNGLGRGAHQDGDASLVDPVWRSFFARHRIDLLVFTAENELAFRSGVPFAVTIQDIQHRLNPQFPEVSADGEWELREFRVGNCVRNAAQVLVDSEVGKEDICNVYELPESAVSVVPLAPAAYLSDDIEAEHASELLSAYQLPERFVFYPAAFWPHKNHRRIVEAIAMLRDEGYEVPLVLVGSSSGPLREKTFADVTECAKQLGVSDLVIYLGYVEDESMSALYTKAVALVMPTFFGWTNIPVLEAFKFGCPVVYSDIRGLREQVGDAAVLVDPE